LKRLQAKRFQNKEILFILSRLDFIFWDPINPIFFEVTARSSKGDFVKRADEFYCEINRDGVDGSILPKSWGGTSGSAVWKGIGEIPLGTIVNFDLAGVQADEARWVWPCCSCHIQGTPFFV
jgi:hypothetical protein